MAQLIYFKNRPKRHHTVYKEKILSLNKTISLNSQKQIENFPLLFDTFEQQKSNLIKRYLINRLDTISRGSMFGIKTNNRRIAVQIIILLYHWHHGIAEEAQAMLELSKKIAQTVLNCELHNDSARDELNIITRYLKEYFSIVLLLSYKNSSLSTKLGDYFEQLPFLSVHHHDKDDQLKICWQGESRSLALDAKDLGWILSRAIHNIINIEKTRVSS